MSRVQILLGILLFAAVTAGLYVWGLRKSISQATDLRRILTGKCAGKVLRYLRKNEVISQAEIAKLVTGVRAGEFWSRQRISVQEPKKFAEQLTKFLLSQQRIEEAGKGKYRLKI